MGQTLVKEKLKEYRTLRFDKHMLEGDVQSILQPDGRNQDMVMNTRTNDEDDELLYILVGARIKDEGILTSDKEYRELNFSPTNVWVKLVDKKGKGTENIDITQIVVDTANNLGFDFKVLDFSVLEKDELEV